MRMTDLRPRGEHADPDERHDDQRPPRDSSLASVLRAIPVSISGAHGRALGRRLVFLNHEEHCRVEACTTHDSTSSYVGPRPNRLTVLIWSGFDRSSVAS